MVSMKNPTVTIGKNIRKDSELKFMVKSAPNHSNMLPQFLNMGAIG
jgi:hypothetical protein